MLALLVASCAAVNGQSDVTAGRCAGRDFALWLVEPSVEQ
jgi:hypothetical protein